MTDPCCQRFAPFHADPARFFAARAELGDLQAAARGGGVVTVTARGLFLTRAVEVQHASDQIHDGKAGWTLPGWAEDTYCGGLGLDGATLERWRAARPDVLDVASGLALFATEAAALGITVDCADLTLDAAHPAFLSARARVLLPATSYADQIAFLRCLSRHAQEPRYRMDQATTRILDLLHAARDSIAASYPGLLGRRFLADARTLDSVPDGHYDVTLCGWLLVHLDDADQARVVQSLVRVTRPGGEVRLKAGYGGKLHDRLAVWLSDGDGGVGTSGRRVKVTAGAAPDAVVLAV